MIQQSQTIDLEAEREISRSAEFWAGVRATFPLLVGAAPFGLIFGAMSINSGLSLVTTAALSAFVYAGAAQFIAVGMVASGVAIPVIVLTTLVINLRHVLYGASLAPYLQRLSQRWLAFLAFGLTDETYVVAINRYQQPDRSPYRHWYHTGSLCAMYVNWQIWTYVGALAGQALPDPQGWGLDFAFVATFLGILAPTLRSRPMILCALVAGVSALALRELPNQLGLIVATLLGVLAGALASQQQKSLRANSEEAE